MAGSTSRLLSDGGVRSDCSIGTKSMMRSSFPELGTIALTTPVLRKDAAVQEGFFAVGDGMTAGDSADASISVGVRFGDGSDSNVARTSFVAGNRFAQAGPETASIGTAGSSVLSAFTDEGELSAPIGTRDFLAQDGLELTGLAGLHVGSIGEISAEVLFKDFLAHAGLESAAGVVDTAS